MNYLGQAELDRVPLLTCIRLRERCIESLISDGISANAPYFVSLCFIFSTKH